MNTSTTPNRTLAKRTFWLCAVAFTLSACAVGPDFQQPTANAPANWNEWHNGSGLQLPQVRDQTLPANWWRAFNDPVLNQLIEQALHHSPDVHTAALHVAQARMQRAGTVAQYTPSVALSGGVSRQRISETGSGTRMLDAVGGSNRDALAQMLASPYNLYQTGFDASWEPDFWGRIRRSVEAADAGIARQDALLDLTRLTLVSDVAKNYFSLRTTQAQIALMQQDIAALREIQSLTAARAQRGLLNHIDTERQQSELNALAAQLPPLMAQENALTGQLALLSGEQPGALNALLQAQTAAPSAGLPDLSLGMPSEIARRRPDILAAEAQLHSATASIGAAKADLYPSIRIGAKFGLESTQSSGFSAWGNRVWSVGPSLDLPIFDSGRRVSVVKLRGLEQQEAAVNYQKTVLNAWKEIDEALSAYAAAQQETAQLAARTRNTAEALRLVNARYKNGLTDYTAVLDARRRNVQAQQALAAAQGRLNTQFAALNKAVGNVPVNNAVVSED